MGAVIAKQGRASPGFRPAFRLRPQRVLQAAARRSHACACRSPTLPAADGKSRPQARHASCRRRRTSVCAAGFGGVRDRRVRLAVEARSFVFGWGVSVIAKQGRAAASPLRRPAYRVPSQAASRMAHGSATAPSRRESATPAIPRSFFGCAGSAAEPPPRARTSTPGRSPRAPSRARCRRGSPRAG